MIKRFYADNFRCLTNFELELDEANVFLGANGSGKSSVLDVLWKLQRLIAGRGRLDEVFFQRDLSFAQNRDEQRFELDLRIDDQDYLYRLVIDHHRDDNKMRIGEEVLKCEERPLFVFRKGEAQLYRDNYDQGPKYPFDWNQSGVSVLHERPDNRKLSRFKQELANWVIVRPCPPLFVSETRSEDRVLDLDMNNFVGWYRYVSQENMGAVVDLFTELRDVVPGFESLSLAETGENARALKAVYANASPPGPRSRYGFDQLSDGQCALISLYSLLCLPEGRGRRPSLFIDEPDNYLSLREVQPWVVKLAESCGETLEQAVVVSHHPITIDYLAGSSGRWFFRDLDGPVRVRNEPERSNAALAPSELIARFSSSSLTPTRGQQTIDGCN